MQKWLLRLSCALVAMVAMFAAYHTADGDQDATIPMSSNAQYDLNHMSTPASKWRLGYLLNHALNPSGFQQLNNGQVLVGNGSNVGTAVTLSGAATMSNSGVLTSNPNIFQEVTGTLSSGQILTMFTTPVALTPTPAAGTVQIPIELEWNHVYASSGYGGGGKVILQYAVGSTPWMEASINTVTGTATSVYYMRPSFFDINASTGTVPQDLQSVSGSSITVTNATGVFTTGATGNVVNYRLKYRTVPVP